jgi:hypothetical protein
MLVLEFATLARTANCSAYQPGTTRRPCSLHVARALTLPLPRVQRPLPARSHLRTINDAAAHIMCRLARSRPVSILMHFDMEPCELLRMAEFAIV